MIINQMLPGGGYIRPPMFLNSSAIVSTNFQTSNLGLHPNLFNNSIIPNPQHATHYNNSNLNHSWPAATSTEIWNQQMQQQRMMTATPTVVVANSWDPALPISSNFAQPAHQQQKPSILMNSMSGGHRFPTAVWPTTGNKSSANNFPIVDAWPAANQPN